MRLRKSRHKSSRPEPIAALGTFAESIKFDQEDITTDPALDISAFDCQVFPSHLVDFQHEGNVNFDKFHWSNGESAVKNETPNTSLNMTTASSAFVDNAFQASAPKVQSQSKIKGGDISFDSGWVGEEEYVKNPVDNVIPKAKSKRFRLLNALRKKKKSNSKQIDDCDHETKDKDNEFKQKTKGMKLMIDTDSFEDDSFRQDQQEIQKRQHEGGNNDTMDSYFEELGFGDTRDFKEFGLGSFPSSGDAIFPSFHVPQQKLHQNQGECALTFLSDKMSEVVFGENSDDKNLSNNIIDSTHLVVSKTQVRIKDEDCGNFVENPSIWEKPEGVCKQQGIISLRRENDFEESKYETCVQNDGMNEGMLESRLPLNNETDNTPIDLDSATSFTPEVASSTLVQQLSSAHNSTNIRESNLPVEIIATDKQDTALRDAFSKTSLFSSDLEDKQTSHSSANNELSPEWNPNFSPAKRLTPTSDVTDEDAPIDLDTMERWNKLSPLQVYKKTPEILSLHHPYEDSGPVDVDTLERWKPTEDISWSCNLASADSEITEDELFIKSREKIASPLLPEPEVEDSKVSDENVLQISSSKVTQDKIQSIDTDAYPFFEPIKNSGAYGSDYQRSDIESYDEALQNEVASLVSQSKLTLSMLAKISALVDFEDETHRYGGSSYVQSENDDDEEEEEEEELDKEEPQTCTSISFDPSDHDIKLITEAGKCEQASTHNNLVDVSPFKIDVSDIQNNSQSQEEMKVQDTFKSLDESPFQSNISAIHQNQSHHILEEQNSNGLVSPRSLVESFDQTKQVEQGQGYRKEDPSSLSSHNMETANQRADNMNIRSVKEFWQEKQANFVNRSRQVDEKEKRVMVEWEVVKTERKGSSLGDSNGEKRDPSIPAIVSQDSISECFGDDFSTLCPSHQTPLTADLLAKNSSMIRSSTSSPTSFFRRTHPTKLSRSVMVTKSKKGHEDHQDTSRSSEFYENKSPRPERKFVNALSQVSKEDNSVKVLRDTSNTGKNGNDDSPPPKNYKDLLARNRQSQSSFIRMDVKDNKNDFLKKSPSGTRDGELGLTQMKTFRPRKWVSGLEVAEPKQTHDESKSIHNVKSSPHDRKRQSSIGPETMTRRSRSPLLEWREKLKEKQLQNSEEKLITATTDVMAKNPLRPKPANSPNFATMSIKTILGKNPLHEINMQESVQRGNTTSTELNQRETFAPSGLKPDKPKKRHLHNLHLSKSFGNEQNDIDDDAMSGTSSAIADRIATFETRMRAAAKSRAPSPRISKTSMNTFTQPTIGLTARNDVGGLW